MDINTASPSRVRSEIQDCRRKQQEIDTVLSRRSPVSGGTYDFSYFQLRKQREEVSERMESLNRMLTPDIIA